MNPSSIVCRMMAFAVVAAMSIDAAPTAAADEPAADERVWDGYLFRDREGRIQVGWAVIAMGVMAQPAHLVGEPLAAKLGPLVSDRIPGPYVFWNYSLGKGSIDELPKVLVRLRGRVRELDSGIHHNDLVMESPELVHVEWHSAAWLRSWAKLWTPTGGAPYLFDVPTDREAAQAEVDKVLPILIEMRAHPGPNEAERALVAAIAPEARVVEYQRLRTQWAAQRWLIRASEMHGFASRELAAMGGLPPTAEEIQAWFLDTDCPTAFLARVSARWSGELGQLSLYYYESKGPHTWYETTDLARVRDWPVAEFVRRQELTRRTLRR